MPRFVMTIDHQLVKKLAQDHRDVHCLFIGRSRDSICPYEPNISLRCASVTFLVSFSTTIFEL